METPQPICDVINDEKSDGNSESLKVELTESVTLVRFDITILGLAGLSQYTLAVRTNDVRAADHHL